MVKFIVNKGMSNMVPQYELEAEGYREDGSFTKFYNEDDEIVLSLRTDTVFSIATN